MSKLFKRLINYLYNTYVAIPPMFIEGKIIWPVDLRHASKCDLHTDSYYHPELWCGLCKPYKGVAQFLRDIELKEKP